MKKKSIHEFGDYVRIYSLIPEEGLLYVGRLCPECGKELVEWDGGDQGGVSFIYCESDECKYEER